MTTEKGGAAELCTDLMTGKVGQLVEYQGIGYQSPCEVRQITSATPTRLGVAAGSFHRKNGMEVGSSRRDSWSSPPRIAALTSERCAKLKIETRVRNARDLIRDYKWSAAPDDLILSIAAMLTERAKRAGGGA